MGNKSRTTGDRAETAVSWRQQATDLQTLAVGVLNGDESLLPALRHEGRSFLRTVCGPGCRRHEYLQEQLDSPVVAGRELSARILGMLLRMRAQGDLE